MTWNHIMGLISTAALSLPIILMLATRLASYRSFPALLAYYTIVAMYNLFTEGYIDVSHDFVSYWGIANNLLDAPLMLLFLTYFANTTTMKKRLRLAVIGILVFEAVIIAIYGFTVKAITIIMAPDLLLVVSLSAYFFARQTKITVVYQKAVGKALMMGSLLIGYGCYTIIYIMYYLLKNDDIKNTFLVYFLVSTFSSLLMSAGIFMERKRVKKLSELKIMRRELSEIYGHEKTASPVRQAVLDFDREPWKN